MEREHSCASTRVEEWDWTIKAGDPSRDSEERWSRRAETLAQWLLSQRQQEQAHDSVRSAMESADRPDDDRPSKLQEAKPPRSNADKRFSNDG